MIRSTITGIYLTLLVITLILLSFVGKSNVSALNFVTLLAIRVQNPLESEIHCFKSGSDVFDTSLR